MKRKVLFFLILMVVLNSGAQTIYVSTTGNDTNPGTKEKPVSSFTKAQQLVRKLPEGATVKVLFARGVYYLPETIRFTDADTKASVIYQAEEEGGAIISGGTLLELEWKHGEKCIFVATIKENPSIDQLCINGKRQRMARFPNAITDLIFCLFSQTDILVLANNKIYGSNKNTN